MKQIGTYLANHPHFIDGCKYERERIIMEIENAPIAFDFFGPYISKEKLYQIIRGETE